MTLEECYPYVETPFGSGGEFYDPASGHGGADYPSRAGDPVLAYAPGVVGYVGSSGWGGGVVGMKLDAGDFAGWAHLDPVVVREGQRVAAGDVIGYTAGWDGHHGTSWTGPHIHTTRSALSSQAAALGYRPLLDPAPGIAAAIKNAVRKGLTVLHYHREDKFSRSEGRVLAPREHLYLNTSSRDKSAATNVVGGVGPYSITVHVYAKGTPGEAVDVLLMWQSKDRKNSFHYVERMVFDQSGTVNRNVEFKRAVAEGYSVFARVQSPSSNVGQVTVRLLDTDAYLIK